MRGSRTAAKLVKSRDCLLEFEQFSQVWRLSCTVRRLPARSPAREATLWHNRSPTFAQVELHVRLNHIVGMAYQMHFSAIRMAYAHA